jgi:hypothetical protein
MATSILADNALTTYSAAKAEVMAMAPGATLLDDNVQTIIERIINAASEAIEAYCGRPFSYAEDDVTLSVPPEGDTLTVRRTPIDMDEDVTAELDGIPLEVSVDNAERGLIYCAGGFGGTMYESVQQVRGADGLRPTVTYGGLPGVGRHVLEVTYSGGYVTPAQAAGTEPPGTRTLPYAIEQACLMTVARCWRMRQSGYMEMADRNIAIGRSTDGIIPDEAIGLLKPYRVST